MVDIVFYYDRSPLIIYNQVSLIGRIVMSWSRKKIDLTGAKVGKLTVERDTEARVYRSVVWLLRCECGGSRLESAAWIKKRMNNPIPANCGCEPRTHGMVGTATYTSWHSMCSRVRNKEYIHHFGKVFICDEWDTSKGGSFDNFYRDMGERPEGTTINRINGAEVYSKETCEWAGSTLQVYDQCRRKDNTSGKTGVQKSWKGKWLAMIKKEGVSTKLYYGDSYEEAVAARVKAELEIYGFNRDNEQTHIESPE